MLVKIKDIMFSTARKLFSSKTLPPVPPPHEIERIPNIFIPWEIFPDKDPDIFRCTQGMYEYWFYYIYIPYWSQLSEEEQKAMKLKAPSPEWLDWVERVTIHENIVTTKDYHKLHAIPFDYRFYLKDFMIAYANHKTQGNSPN